MNMPTTPDADARWIARALSSIEAARKGRLVFNQL